MRVEEVRACERRIASLYGEAALADMRADPARVLHPIAVWMSGNRSTTLRIGPHAPPSADDAFALALARARSDWIVTSGRNLRDEPGLRHGWEALPEGRWLTAWRGAVLRRSALPRIAILTRGAGLDFEHPVLAEGRGRVAVVTSKEAARDLGAAARDRGIEVVGREAPGLRDLLGFLRGTRDGRTISVEVGPSTSGDLYRAPLAIDELLLSSFLGELAPEARGGAFLGGREISSLLGAPASSVLRGDPAAGHWRLERFVRS